MEKISSLERIRAAIHHSAKLDRIPVIPMMRLAAIKLAGYRLGETFENWENVAEAEMRAWRCFGYDGVFARMPFDVDVAALGGNLIYTEDNPPNVGPPYLVGSVDDIDKIKEPDLETCSGMQKERALAKNLVEQLGEGTPVIGYCQGPLRFASYLRGLQAFMEDLYEKNALVFKLLDLVTHVSAIRAHYLIESGVRMIEIGDPVASGDLISPQFYETFAYEWQKALIDRIHAMDDVYVILHICGNTSNILSKMAETGADVLSLDSKVDLGFARSVLGDHVTLMGNVDPVHTLTFASPEHVRLEALECIRKAGPGGLILSSGCALGRDTPSENIAALVNAAKEI